MKSRLEQKANKYIYMATDLIQEVDFDIGALNGFEVIAVDLLESVRNKIEKENQ